jgi:hypothetical protein
MLMIGVIFILGPRDFGKTVTAKKVLAWLMLTGRVTLAGFYSETLVKAANGMDDIAELIMGNERILHDYRPEQIERNNSQFSFRTAKGRSTIAAFSEGRSVRGFVKGFARPQFLLCDDVETRQSSFTKESIKARADKLVESVGSLAKGSTTVILGNNFEAASLTNRLLTDQEHKVLPSTWKVFIFKAWDKGRSLWPARYPGKSEEEMKALVGAVDEADWQGNSQQNPIPPEGFVFVRQHLQFWEALPRDMKGVVYVDPNLAMKSKGDTTGIVRMLYSPSKEAFYISARCRSYKEPHELLNDALDMRTMNVRALGFDGHVNQESHWSAHIRAWCRDKKQPYPSVEFKRYNVDELATNFQTVYNKGQVYFDPALKGTEEGERFFQQFFAFTTKKARRKDDAPDACICAYQLLTERKLVRRVNLSGYTPIIVNDVY